MTLPFWTKFQARMVMPSPEGSLFNHDPRMMGVMTKGGGVHWLRFPSPLNPSLDF